MMPFGLMNVPSTFQRMMHELMGHTVLVRVYPDDVLIFSKPIQDQIFHLCEVVNVVLWHGFKAKVSECEFEKREIQLLRHIVGQKGFEIDPGKIKTFNIR